MLQSRLFLHTLREPPADAEVISHKLLSKAGFITKLASGVYSYTPAMWKVLLKISQIVREEMNRENAQEVMLPILQSTSIWEESGRLSRYVDEGILFHFHDRKNAHVCLGPTHEEVITTLVRTFINSYKQLPITLYQIQTKFRDEIRPRFGLMRGREFIMKDAYSFDTDEDSMRDSYQAMSRAYHAIFNRIGLEYRCVEADSGAIGGTGSQEFMVLAESGEDTILFCDSCTYASNQERTSSTIAVYEQDLSPLPKEDVLGEGLIGVEALSEFLNIPIWKTTKTILFMADEKPVAVMVRGDCEVNEIKVRNALHCTAFRMMTPEEIKELTGADVGYAGPLGLPAEVTLLADHYVGGRINFECGANRTDYHTINVNFGRDLPEPQFGDFKLAQAGEGCPKCDSGHLKSMKGIEVGHIFQLGTKYSECMSASFTDEGGKPAPFVMGCYGIGVSRIAAAVIEQCHDEMGMIWPQSVAPFDVHIICVNPKLEEQLQLAQKLFQELKDAGFDALFDDRKLSAGVKFKDADLIGLPLRITVGRDAAIGKVEFARRTALKEKQILDSSEVLSAIIQASNLSQGT
jgi:prolyl-tRNA synthetase